MVSIEQLSIYRDGCGGSEVYLCITRVSIAVVHLRDNRYIVSYVH